MEVRKETKTLAIIILIVGLIVGVSSLSFTLFGSTMDEFYIQTGATAKYIYSVISRMIGVIISVFLIIGAIGILKTKEWGRKITVYALIITSITIAGSLVYKISTRSFIGKPIIYEVARITFELILIILAMLFLNIRKVKQSFQITN